MKKCITALLIAAVAAGVLPGCKKKKEGVCYCKYVSGDKKEYDLRSLNRSHALDSCRTLDGYAHAFGGECRLKE